MTFDLKTTASDGSAAVPLDWTEAEGIASPGIPDATAPAEARALWIARRSYMETHHEKRLPDGRRHLRRFPVFKFLIAKLGIVLRLFRLYDLGLRNAIRVELNRMEIAFDDLPREFDGYTILHITDLHVDGLPDAARRLTEVVDGIAPDVCVLTGDYRFDIKGPFDEILPPLEALVAAVSARDGVYAVLGNHDTVEMVEPFERLGMRVLANETVTLRRDGAELHLVGIDDVHYFYTDRALEALETAPKGFKVALVHSPEIVGPAADSGMSLYLTGHTHGGQICLPGGRPILINIAGPRRYASGLWRCDGMVGYTSTGAGISGLPVRYFSKSEAALITLRRNR